MKLNPKSDCIACILRPMLVLTSIFGPYFVVVCCPHSECPSPTVKFAKSKKQPLLALLLILLVTTNMFFNITAFFTVNNFNLKMLVATEILFSIASVVINIFSTMNYNLILTELNGLAAILENREYYGFTSLLDQKTTKIYIRKVYLMTFSCLLPPTLVLIYAVYNSYQTYLLVAILRVFVFFLDMLAQSIMISQHYIETSLYQLLFKKCFNNIKDMLIQQEVGENVHFMVSEITQALPQKHLKIIKFQRLNNMYMSLVWNFRHLSAFMQPSLLVIWIMIVFLLIACFYITLLDYTEEFTADPLLEVRTYGTLAAVILVLIKVEQLSSVVSNLP